MVHLNNMEYNTAKRVVKFHSIISLPVLVFLSHNQWKVSLAFLAKQVWKTNRIVTTRGFASTTISKSTRVHTNRENHAQTQRSNISTIVLTFLCVYMNPCACPNVCVASENLPWFKKLSLFCFTIKCKPQCRGGFSTLKKSLKKKENLWNQGMEYQA